MQNVKSEHKGACFLDLNVHIHKIPLNGTVDREVNPIVA